MSAEAKSAERIQAAQRGKQARRQTESKKTEVMTKKAVAMNALAEELFFKYDSDGSGTLGFKEMAAAIRDLMAEAGAKVRLNMKQFEEQFDAADADGDNKVTFEEFVNWYNGFANFARVMAQQAEELPTAKGSCGGATARKSSGGSSSSTLTTPRGQCTDDGKAIQLELSTDDQALIFDLMTYDAKGAQKKKLHQQRDTKEKLGAERGELALASRDLFKK